VITFFETGKRIYGGKILHFSIPQTFFTFYAKHESRHDELTVILQIKAE